MRPTARQPNCTTRWRRQPRCVCVLCRSVPFACIASHPPLTTTLISVSSLQDAASELGIRKMQYDEAKHSYEAIEKVCVRAAVWHTSRADTLTHSPHNHDPQSPSCAAQLEKLNDDLEQARIELAWALVDQACVEAPHNNAACRVITFSPPL